MMLYNQGYDTNGPFRLNLDPASAAAIRNRLAGPRFLASVPGSTDACSVVPAGTAG